MKPEGPEGDNLRLNTEKHEHEGGSGGRKLIPSCRVHASVKLAMLQRAWDCSKKAKGIPWFGAIFSGLGVYQFGALGLHAWHGFGVRREQEKDDMLANRA